MTLIGLDLNATRARAVHGPVQHLPVVLPLEGARAVEVAGPYPCRAARNS